MTAAGRARVVDLDRLRAEHSRAVALSRAGRPADAERILKRLLAAVEDAPPSPEAATLRVQTFITLAKVESEMKGIDVGLARLDEAARLRSADVHDVVLTALHNQRGALQIRIGSYDDAITSLDAAERHFAAAEPRDVVAVLLNRSTAHMLTGNLRRAAADVERCVATAATHGFGELRAMAQHNLGYLHFLLGDLPRAIAEMDAAEQRENEGVALLDRARVLAEAGLVREADDLLAAAAAIARKYRLAQDLGEIELERARCALVADDVLGARRFAASARDRFRRRGSDSWRRSAELTLLQGDLAADRPGTRLLPPALRLRAEFDAAGLDGPARTAALIAVEAALAADELDVAAGLMSDIRPARPRDPITMRLHGRYVRAALRVEQGRQAAAAREARAGLEELSAYQSTFGSIDLQTAAAVHGRRLADLGVAVALRSGRPADVLAAAESARAASNRLPVVRPPADRTAADLLAELRQVSESLHAAQDRDESLALHRRRRELEARIAARGWALGGPGETRDPVGVDEVCAAATASDCEVVTYVQSGGVLHAVVAGSGLRLQTLGASAVVVEQVRRARADLDVLAQPQLPVAMRQAVQASFERSMHALDDALLRPLAVDGRRLVVVSTGALGQLPWTALHSLSSVPVVVAPSATVWVGAVRARRRRDRSVATLAGPGVPLAGREIDGVRTAWAGADVRSEPHADRASFVVELGRAAVVHVAAHGTHNTENALFSSVRLSDGHVFAHELDRTRRAAEHVVLSACELGLATVRPGDEALGLASVLLRLGTRSVVAGVARVNDETTAAVMGEYHRGLAGGRDSATALADAIAAADGVAPFVCFGSAWTRAQPA